MEPAEGGASGKDGTGLRLARQARGFSQQQLAGMAGVSRQLVAAVESGRSVASLRVGLAFARALGLSVGELFGLVTPSPPVSAQPVAPVGEAGFRVALAPIGDTFVALPLTGTAAYRTGFAPASGLMTGADASRSQPVDAQPCSSGRGSARPIRLVRPIGVPRPALVVAGDDPALPLLEVPLGLLDPPLGLAWWPGGTKAALRLAAKGLVHAAAVCVRETSGERRTGPGAPFVRRGTAVVAFCSWREGLVLRPEQAAGIAGVADLHRAGLRVVNREPGAEARRILDTELADQGIDPRQLSGYETRAAGRLQVAAAIAAGLADAGVASEPAALAYGLAFVPLARERVDLVIPAAAAQSGRCAACSRCCRRVG